MGEDLCRAHGDLRRRGQPVLRLFKSIVFWAGLAVCGVLLLPAAATVFAIRGVLKATDRLIALLDRKGNE